MEFTYEGKGQNEDDEGQVDEFETDLTRPNMPLGSFQKKSGPEH